MELHDLQCLSDTGVTKDSHKMGKKFGVHGSVGNLEQNFEWRMGWKESIQKSCVNMGDNIGMDFKESIRMEFDNPCFRRALKDVLMISVVNFKLYKIGDYLENLSKYWHLTKYCTLDGFSVMISSVLLGVTISGVLFGVTTIGELFGVNDQWRGVSCYDQ